MSTDASFTPEALKAIALDIQRFHDDALRVYRELHSQAFNLIAEERWRDLLGVLTRASDLQLTLAAKDAELLVTTRLLLRAHKD